MYNYIQEKGGGRTPPGTKTRESTSAWLFKSYQNAPPKSTSKSVIFDWFPGTKRVPCGLAVKEWFAEKEAQSGGPFFFIAYCDILDLDDGDHATLLGCLLEIGTTADEAKVTRIIDADSETRKGLWEGIWDNMRGTYKSFDDYWMANARDVQMKKTANALWHIRSILLD